MDETGTGRSSFIVCKSSLFVIVVYTVKTMYAFSEAVRGVMGAWEMVQVGGTGIVR